MTMAKMKPIVVNVTADASGLTNALNEALGKWRATPNAKREKKAKKRAQGFNDAALILANAFGIEPARLQEISIDSHVSPRTEDTASDITLRVTVLEHDDPQVVLNRVEIDKRKRAEARDAAIRAAVKDFNLNAEPFRTHRQAKVQIANTTFQNETRGLRMIRNEQIRLAQRIYNEGR